MCLSVCSAALARSKIYGKEGPGGGWATGRRSCPAAGSSACCWCILPSSQVKPSLPSTSRVKLAASWSREVTARMYGPAPLVPTIHRCWKPLQGLYLASMDLQVSVRSLAQEEAVDLQAGAALGGREA